MRKLKADEIECRVAQVSAKGCSLLLYKTARTDATILTEMYGENWQNDFKVIDGKMYGGIGVWNKELQQWVWRWDCGTESNTEAEKGQASDAFKRAGFKFLIGQELYKAPFIFVQCETIKEGNKYKLVNPYVKYNVSEISYADNGDIDKLKIVDDKKNIVYEMGKAAKKPKNDFVPDVVKESKEEYTKEELNDLDIYEGLKATSDKKEAFKYFTDNSDKVSDKTKFRHAWQAHIKQFGG